MMIQFLGFLLIAGGLVWWAWPKVSQLLPTSKSSDVDAEQAKAFAAVRTLVAYFSIVGHTDGKAAARRCGQALFEEPADEV